MSSYTEPSWVFIYCPTSSGWKELKRKWSSMNVTEDNKKSAVSLWWNCSTFMWHLKHPDSGWDTTLRLPHGPFSPCMIALTGETAWFKGGIRYACLCCRSEAWAHCQYHRVVVGGGRGGEESPKHHFLLAKQKGILKGKLQASDARH